MRPDPTRVKRGPVLGFLFAVAALFALALISMAAHAGEPSKCGAQATGIDRTIRTTAEPNGRVVSGAFPRRWVDSSGVWRDCQPWIADGGDPTLPEPKPELACPAETHYRAWEVDGVQCTSIPPGESTASTLMLRRTPAGRVGLLMTQPGNWLGTEGMLLMRCVAQPDGTVAWRQDGATCRWINSR